MVGKNIKHFREEKGMTQAELAEILFVTRQAVSNWETEKAEPDIDTLQKIAAALEVSVEELIYGEKRDHTVMQKNIKKGISFGSALAMVISYTEWGSIGWAIVHGLMNWFYVFYFIAKYR